MTSFEPLDNGREQQRDFFKAGLNPSDERSHQALELKLQRAVELLSTLATRTSLVEGVERNIFELAQRREVSQVAWHTSFVMAEQLPVGAERETIHDIISLFYAPAPQSVLKNQIEVRTENLSPPFVKYLQLVAVQLKRVMTFEGLGIGVNEMDPFRRSMMAEHWKEFAQSFIEMADGLDLELVARDSGLKALRALIGRRALLASFSAALLSFDEKEMQSEGGKRKQQELFLQVDFADRAYAHSLYDTSLPESFTAQLHGPGVSIPEMRLATLDFQGKELLPERFNQHQIAFLELMRDSGIAISEAGIATSIKNRNAVVAPDLSKLLAIIAQRKEDLNTLLHVLSDSEFSATPAGDQLGRVIHKFKIAQEVALACIMAKTEIEFRELNKTSKSVSEQIVKEVADARFPVYMEHFLRLCCRNKVPVVAVGVDDI